MEELLNGKYRIRSELGRGGMGIVYLATHDSLHRDDALKILHPDLSGNRQFVERFISEARSMACLDHDNIVGIYDIFEHDGLYCIAMEYFRGMSLRSWIRDKHPLTLKQILSIITQTAKGLAYAHAHGIVHRDIKPGNILVNNQMTVKIADFGVAAAMSETKFSLTGEIVGSPLYMPQEQARGGTIDHRSDLYSLGIVFYQLLTGSPPYEDDIGPDSKAEFIGRLISQTEELTLQFPKHVPKNIQELVRRLLYRDPIKRVKDAKTLLCELGVITDFLANESTITNTDKSVTDYVEQTLIILSEGEKKTARFDVSKKRPRSLLIQRRQNIILGLLVTFLSVSGMLYFIFQFDKPTVQVISANSTYPTKMLAITENKLTDTESQPIHTYNASRKNKAVIEIENMLDEALLLQQEVFEIKLRAKQAGAKQIKSNEYTRGNYFLEKADALFIQSGAWLRQYDLVNSSKDIDAAVIAYKKSLEYFTLAKDISVKNIALNKIEKRENQLRLLQLQINIAQISSERNRPGIANLSEYKRANEMHKKLNWSLKQFVVLNDSTDLEYFNNRLIELLILAKETKLAYRLVSRIQLKTPKTPKTLLASMGINARSPETKKVERILLDLAQALQSKDVDKLKTMADISETRLATLQQIFKKYPRLAVSIRNYSLAENTAAAELRLEKLITTQGEEIVPDSRWRNIKLVAQKKTRGWEKFIWD